ncbi:hypothetical protein C8R48DRAFT_458637 [Suillus tomentosus]|nr:hypothetical protein C8R48DRAFT_458637 [Suillus tomentosus]
MSNLPEPPPSSTEKLTVKKVLRATGVGIVLLSNIINGLCIATIFMYLGWTIPALNPYAGYVSIYSLGVKTMFPACVFLVGCYWCCLRLVAPKQAGSSFSDWAPKPQDYSCETLSPSNGKLGRAGRIHFALMGVFHTTNSIYHGFRFWKEPEFSVYEFVTSVILLLGAAHSIQIAYVGRVWVPTKKGTRGNNMTLGNNDS